MLIKTIELKYDDRLLKEIRSLERLNLNVNISAVNQDNSRSKGLLLDHIKYKTYTIFTRNLLPKKKFLALKGLEMYTYFVLSILFRKPKIIWLHNLEMIGLFGILSFFKKIGFIKGIVWDQHELPPEQFFKSMKLQRRLQYSFDVCDTVIAASESRKAFIEQYYCVPNYEVLLNLPDLEFIKAEKKTLMPKYEKWVEGRPYMITTGLNDENLRYISNIALAMDHFDEFCLIIMGPYSTDTINYLESTLNKNISNRVLFTGFISKAEVLNITDNSFCSIVLYNSTKLNNQYCAPNRLYQAGVRGIPLIVGSNPPLKEFIEKCRIGYTINNDGHDIGEIVKAIKIVQKKRKRYIANMVEVRDRFNWNSNNPTIDKIVMRLI